MSEIKSSQSFGSFVILGILGIGFRGVVYSITGPNDHTVYLVRMKEVDRSHQADECLPQETGLHRRKMTAHLDHSFLPQIPGVLCLRHHHFGAQCYSPIQNFKESQFFISVKNFLKSHISNLQTQSLSRRKPGQCEPSRHPTTTKTEKDLSSNQS